MGCQAAPNIHLCPCYGLGSLWLFLSVTELTAWLLECVLVAESTHPPTHPSCSPTPLYISDTHDITGGFQKPAISSSCQLMLAIRLVIQNVTIQLVFLTHIIIVYQRGKSSYIPKTSLKLIWGFGVS